jgi:hypothetical protein
MGEMGAALGQHPIKARCAGRLDRERRKKRCARSLLLQIPEFEVYVWQKKHKIFIFCGVLVTKKNLWLLKDKNLNIKNKKLQISKSSSFSSLFNAARNQFSRRN